MYQWCLYTIHEATLNQFWVWGFISAKSWVGQSHVFLFFIIVYILIELLKPFPYNTNKKLGKTNIVMKSRSTETLVPKKQSVGLAVTLHWHSSFMIPNTTSSLHLMTVLSCRHSSQTGSTVLNFARNSYGCVTSLDVQYWQQREHGSFDEYTCSSMWHTFSDVDSPMMCPCFVSVLVDLHVTYSYL